MPERFRANAPLTSKTGRVSPNLPPSLPERNRFTSTPTPRPKRPEHVLTNEAFNVLRKQQPDPNDFPYSPSSERPYFKERNAWDRCSITLKNKQGTSFTVNVGYRDHRSPSAVLIGTDFLHPLNATFYQQQGERMLESYTLGSGARRVTLATDYPPEWSNLVFTNLETLSEAVQFALDTANQPPLSSTDAQQIWDQWLSRSFQRATAEQEQLVPEWCWRPDPDEPSPFAKWQVVDEQELEEALRASPDQLLNDRYYFPHSAITPAYREARTAWDTALTDAKEARELYREELNRWQARSQQSALNPYERVDAPETFPFRPAVGGGLTDGPHYIPPERPHGNDWRAVHPNVKPLQSVDKKEWSKLLDTVKGTYYKDLPDAPKRLTQTAREATGGAQRKRREAVIGQCIQLHLLDSVRSSTSFGERLLIEGARTDGSLVYVVDSPNHGVGLYLFSAREPAEAWANGSIGYKEARKQAAQFIPHVGNWEERASSALRALSSS